jgi:hypothetical protein
LFDDEHCLATRHAIRSRVELAALRAREEFFACECVAARIAFIKEIEQRIRGNTLGWIAVRKRSSDTRDSLGATESRRFNECARQSRMRWDARHRSAFVGESRVMDRRVCANGTKRNERATRFINACRVGSVEPRKPCEITHAK